ncbi:XkdQ/YqbQ family protein [Veillonella parvula]
MAVNESKTAEQSQINGIITPIPMPIQLHYALTVINKSTGDAWLIEPQDNIQITRAVDCVPSKMTFKVPKDPNLNFEEGDTVKFTLNGGVVFVGFVFEKQRDGKNTILVTCYDQLRYLKNKDCYVIGAMTATEFIKMVAEDYHLNCGYMDNTVWKTPDTPKTVFKDTSLQEMICRLLDKTAIFTPNHAFYHLFDDGGELRLASFETMKTDIYIDDECMQDVQYTTSIDKDTYNYVKIVRTIPNGADSKLENTFIAKDDKNIAKWGRLQYLIIPKEKDINAVVEAKAIMAHKNKKTREIKLKNVIGDVRVRGGSLVYINRNFGDIIVNNYMMVTSVTHTFKTGFHGMDLDLRYVDNDAVYEVAKDEDAEAVKRIEASKKAKSGSATAAGGTSGQVDTAFNANNGRVSQYGSEGCVDTACAAGSYYNKDLADEYNKGTSRVDTLRNNLEAKGYVTEQYNGYANKGDLLLYGNDDHVVIADGAGGCFGNSSSKGYAMKYGNVNYAWRNDEAPTKIIRMGAT